MAGSLVPFILRELRNVGVMPDALVVIMALALLAALVRECVKYVKESENISWNLC